MPYIPHLYTQSCDLWDGTSESQQRAIWGLYTRSYQITKGKSPQIENSTLSPYCVAPFPANSPSVFSWHQNAVDSIIRTQWIRSQPSGIQYLGTPDPASQADSVGPTVSNCHILNYPLVIEQFAMGNYII